MGEEEEKGCRRQQRKGEQRKKKQVQIKRVRRKWMGDRKHEKGKKGERSVGECL